MSDMVIIGGLPVPVSDWKQLAPVQGGSRTRAFAGNLRSTVRWTRESWQGTSTLMLAADVTSLRALVTNGAIVSVGGVLIGTTRTAIVTLGEITPVTVAAEDGSGVKYLVAFTIEAV